MPNKPKRSDISLTLTASEVRHICEVLGSTIEADMLDSSNSGDPSTIVQEWKRHRLNYVEHALQSDAALPDRKFYETLQAQHDAEAALIEKLLPHLEPAAAVRDRG